MDQVGWSGGSATDATAVISAKGAEGQPWQSMVRSEEDGMGGGRGVAGRWQVAGQGEG